MFTTQVADDSVISRVSAFDDVAVRLAEQLSATHVLKLTNLKWFPFTSSTYVGMCTTPVEFRAQRDTTLELGDLLSQETAPSPDLPAEIPSNIPS